MEPAVQSGAAHVPGASKALAVAACLLCAPACGRWGYSALPELVEPRPGAGATAAANPANELRSSLLDAGALLIDDHAISADGWTRPERALSEGSDASAVLDAGPPQSASCDALPPLASAPTLDGQLEPGLALRSVTPAHWTGAGDVPVGNTLSYAAASEGVLIYER